MGPRVSVIIVNYNSGPRLAKCLDHLAAQIFTDFETIVIDNGSSDGSADIVGGHRLAPRLILARENLGFAAANNRAAGEAVGRWLAFLNPDAYARADWLQALLAATVKYPHADAFGSTQLDDAEPALLDGAGDVCHAFGLAYRGGLGREAASRPGDGACFSPCAAAALYRRETFLALGGFDERFFCYGEDVDLGFRLRLADGEAMQISGAVVRHEGSGVTGRYSDFSVYHGNRNRIWLFYKNLPAALYWPLAPFHLAVNLAMLARAAAVGRARPFWRALVDGYAGLPRFTEARRRAQSSRKISTLALARRLTWSPFKLARRAPDLKHPVREAQ